MQQRDQFTFYASFARAAARIRRPADRCAFYDFVVAFALTGAEPDLDRAPESVAIALELVMPVLIASRRKAANRSGKGRRTVTGGDIAEQDADSAEEDENRSEQNGIEPEQEEVGKKKKKEEEGKREEEIEDECPPPVPPLTGDAPAGEIKVPCSPPPPEQHFAGELLDAVRDWLAYKSERRERYKPTGLRNLYAQIGRAAQEHGDAAVAQQIHASIASGYQGLCLDRLRSSPQRQGSDLGRKYQMMRGWADGKA